MIRYNISRSVNDPLRPHDPLPKMWGFAIPKPLRVDAPDAYDLIYRISDRQKVLAINFDISEDCSVFRVVLFVH